MQETKKKLVKLSLNYFFKHGIRKASNQKLVAELGVSTKTLYKHFGNKEKLLEDVLHLYHDKKYEQLSRASNYKNAVVYLFDLWRYAILIETKVSKVFYEDLNYYYPKLASKVESSISKKFSDKFIEIIHKGQKEKLFRDNIETKIIIEGIYLMYVGIIKDKKFNYLSTSTEKIIYNTLGIYIRGFCSTKGTKILESHLSSYNNLK